MSIPYTHFRQHVIGHISHLHTNATGPGVRVQDVVVVTHKVMWPLEMLHDEGGTYDLVCIIMSPPLMDPHGCTFDAA
eukprot:1137150-Pelagomonas_calceolata.AAC.15